MNSKERVFTALNRNEPDRVPTFEWDIDQSVVQALCPGGNSFDFVDTMSMDAVVVSPNYILEKIGENLYLVSNVQIYPEDRGISDSIKLAWKFVEQL